MACAADRQPRVSPRTALDCCGRGKWERGARGAPAAPLRGKAGLGASGRLPPRVDRTTKLGIPPISRLSLSDEIASPRPVLRLPSQARPLPPPYAATGVGAERSLGFEAAQAAHCRKVLS